MLLIKYFIKRGFALLVLRGLMVKNGFILAVQNSNKALFLFKGFIFFLRSQKKVDSSSCKAASSKIPGYGLQVHPESGKSRNFGNSWDRVMSGA